jgi:GNAT superfamily N-acetyltransferase
VGCRFDANWLADDEALRMPHLSTKTTYLEMFGPPPVEIAPPRSDVRIERLCRPTNEDYRRLYRAVGADFHWVDRLVMTDEQLQAILQDDQVEIYVLTAANETAGYAELDRCQPNDIELAYFGLVPRFIGQGLGTFLLNWALRTAWSYRPARVWVHTCDLDHPAALPTYLKAGFRIYDERIIMQFLPDNPSKAFENAE